LRLIIADVREPIHPHERVEQHADVPVGCPSGQKRSWHLLIRPRFWPDGHQTKVQKLGERYFLVGKVAYSSISRFMVGSTLWIPENTVKSIAEFESVEKMTDAFRSYRKSDFQGHDRNRCHVRHL
jgi:hypothetical protein